jgi:serine/threonine protein kinase
VLIQGDIKPYNFLIDPETQSITLIDFGCVCALPSSFISYTLRPSGGPFVAGIAKALNWQDSDNLSAMRLRRVCTLWCRALESALVS